MKGKFESFWDGFYTGMCNFGIPASSAIGGMILMKAINEGNTRYIIAGIVVILANMIVNNMKR